MSRIARKFPTRSRCTGINRAVTPHKMARGLKFQIWEEDGLFYLRSKTKGVISCTFSAQLICAFIFASAKYRFSHDTAHIASILDMK